MRRTRSRSRAVERGLTTLGIDLAAQAKETAACVIRWATGEATVDGLAAGLDDQALLTTIERHKRTHSLLTERGREFGADADDCVSSLASTAACVEALTPTPQGRDRSGTAESRQRPLPRRRNHAASPLAP